MIGGHDRPSFDALSTENPARETVTGAIVVEQPRV